MLNLQSKAPQHDQADGLRKMMLAPETMLISILKTAACHEHTDLLANLASPFVVKGQKVLAIDAAHDSSASLQILSNKDSLIEVLNQKVLMQQVIYPTSLGFSALKLMPKQYLNNQTDVIANQQLNQLFKEQMLDYEVVLAEVSLNLEDALPIKAFAEGEIVIQLTQHTESIQEAYVLIKKLYGQLGTRSFGIIVDSASEAKGEMIFERIAQVANSFMQVKLAYLGAIPPDVHVNRASQLGRSVVEAFPMTIAAKALKQIAGRIENLRPFPTQSAFAPIN
jgi:flagellar biosynthesis protein FlhG